jgi:transcriptional regulator with XRE-family HTH domain
VRVNRLRILRAERRFSQLRTALFAGMNATRYWKIENAFVEPTEAERAAIAGVLQATEAEIWPEVPAADSDPMQQQTCAGFQALA